MSSITEKAYFADLAGYKIDISVTEPIGPVKNTILFLHGAGESTKDRCLPLARLLSELGWHCVCFSAPGHGKSSGQLIGSTLAERLKVAKAVVDHAKIPKGSLLAGVSMGAHTALHLVEALPGHFAKLALFVPAIYSTQAEDVPFGPEFSKILRAPNSYSDSQCWSNLANYPGQLAIIRAGQDKVIPDGVYDLIIKNIEGRPNTQMITVADSPHQITIWLAEQPERLKKMAQALDGFKFKDLKF